MTTPTREFYGLLQQAYDFFNQRLFEGELPAALITAQREKRTMGYFSPDRWASSDGQRAHEIALNPAYFAKHKVIEIFQTLVHEQCHLWQFEFGRHKSRRGYHNREWAAKMQSVGLMPSHTGHKGGRSTGQRMSDYPIPDGVFLQACDELDRTGFRFAWVDRHAALGDSCQVRDTTLTTAGCLDSPLSTLIPDLVPATSLQMVACAKQKVRYNCKGCHANLWGKPGLNVICGSCNLPLSSEGDSHEQQDTH